MTDAPEKRSTENGVAKSAGAMGAAVMISRVLGLVREQVFAILFGAGFATDAFNVAFRIPNLLRDLFAEGAMSAALVPTFIRVRKAEGDRRAWRIAGLVFRVLVVAMILLSVLGIIYSRELVELYAGDFENIEGKVELTTFLTQILFPYFPFVVLAAAFMGILNACGKFFIPAFASALFNATSITVGVILTFVVPSWGYHPIVGMALGVLAGGFVQAFCQYPLLRKVGYRFPSREAGDPVWHRDPNLRKMLLLIAPGTLGLAATQINILVNTILATSQEEGAVSWLNFAFRLMQFPIGVFGVAMAAATLPVISSFWEDSKFTDVGSTLSSSIRNVFALNGAAAAGLAFLSVPIVQLIFQYGQFTLLHAENTAIALVAYAVGLPFYSAVKVLVPACYAMGIVRFAVGSSVLSVILNIGLSLWWIDIYGYWGLALATSVTAFLNFLFLATAVRSRLVSRGGNWEGWKILKSALISFSIALAMGVVVYLVQGGLDEYFLLESWPLPLARTLRVSVSIFVGITFIVAMGRVMRHSEIDESVGFWLRKAGKLLRFLRN